MAQVDAAEKEASEVLHTLLSVERIENKEAIIVDTGNDNQPSENTYQSQTKSDENGENESTLQWHNPVQLGTHSLFSAIDSNSHFTHTMDDHQVVVSLSVY